METFNEIQKEIENTYKLINKKYIYKDKNIYQTMEI